jgi:hypothetical protein
LGFKIGALASSTPPNAGSLCARVATDEQVRARPKTPAEESSLRLTRAGAEGATAPDTLRPGDRSGMTLWKAASRCKLPLFCFLRPAEKRIPSP